LSGINLGVRRFPVRMRRAAMLRRGMASCLLELVENKKVARQKLPG
jgi:hypothetical protein